MLSLQREEIAEHVMRAGETPAFSFTPQGVAGYICDTKIMENGTAARQLLADAGFPNGTDSDIVIFPLYTQMTSPSV